MMLRSRYVDGVYFARENSDGRPHIHILGGLWYAFGRGRLGIGVTVMEAWKAWEQLRGQ